MNLKTKIALYYSLLFSLILGIISSFIYLFYNAIREEEFSSMLSDRLAMISKYVNSNRFDEIDDISDLNEDQYTLPFEQIIVFDENLKTRYTNVKDKSITWKAADLQFLKNNSNYLYRMDGDFEIVGLKIPNADNTKNYYYLMKAKDEYGLYIKDFLKYFILFSFLVSLALVWIISFSFIGKILKPLDDFQKKITKFSFNQTNEKFLISDKANDEINTLAKAYNEMLERVEAAYSSQKEFTSNASHEIKTPLARIAFQLENLVEIDDLNPETRKYIDKISKEVFQISEMVNSLLLFTQLEYGGFQHLEPCRIDEVIFSAYDATKRNFPEFEMNFAIDETMSSEDLNVNGIKSLLEIVFINLFKNANLYSMNSTADVKVYKTHFLFIEVVNEGKIIPEHERAKIFEPFKRGSNSHNISGSGIGLNIVGRILSIHHADISYHAYSEKSNVFELKFPKNQN